MQVQSYSSDRSFSDSHYDPLRSVIKPEPSSLQLPSLAIDPELERIPRAPHPDSATTSAEARHRGRRVESKSQSSSREDRPFETGLHRRTGEHHFDPSVERDRSERNIGVQNTNKFELPGTAHLLNFSHMPHRVESLQMSSFHGRDYDNRHGYSAPSPPPPIATLPHSPSPSASSLDQSTTSSPHPSRRPLPRSSLDSTYSDPYYPQEHPPHRQSGPYPHSSARNTNTYPYPPRPTYDNRYNSSESVNSYQVPNPYPPHITVPSMSVAPVPSMRNPFAGGPQQYVVDVNFTDDATTKLSDRMRRRCFNCCTTDTSTWRRSNLSPGKVLCNKCGLFERTHSRPRPDQFPHRRGSMSSTSGPVRPRTPPAQLPPITNQPQTLPPPHHYNHPSIAPLANVPDLSTRGNNSNPLPEVRSWLNSSPPPSMQLSSDIKPHEQSDRSHPSPPLARQQPRTSSNSHAR